MASSLILLFTTASPNQIIHNIGACRDAGYNVACQAIDYLNSTNFRPPSEAPASEDTAVVFNPSWRGNRDLFNQERAVVNTTFYLSTAASGTTVMSTSDVSPIVTASLDWSIAKL